MSTHLWSRPVVLKWYSNFLAQLENRNPVQCACLSLHLSPQTWSFPNMTRRVTGFRSGAGTTHSQFPIRVSLGGATPASVRCLNADESFGRSLPTLKGDVRQGVCILHGPEKLPLNASTIKTHTEAIRPLDIDNDKRKTTKKNKHAS